MYSLNLAVRLRYMNPWQRGYLRLAGLSMVEALPVSNTVYGLKVMKKLAVMILSVFTVSSAMPAKSKETHSTNTTVSFAKATISKTINITVKTKKRKHSAVRNKEQIKPARPGNGYLFRDDNYISDPNDPRSPKWNKIDDSNCGDYE